MTFGEYILKLRARLQDTRQVTGNPITLITQNGSRWSAAELIEIANSAIMETSRFLALNKDSLLSLQLGSSMLVAHNFGNTDNDGKLVVPSSALMILSVEGENPYEYIQPNRFFEYKLYSTTLLDEQYFTVAVIDGIRYILILPADKVLISYSYVYFRGNYLESDSNTNIHLQGVDDILLDIAEREARDREHNWERSKILDTRIMNKFGKIS